MSVIRLGRWLVAYLGIGIPCLAQRPAAFEGTFDRKNTFTVLADYSNTSSHILAGAARQRKLVTLGGAYTRRVARFRGTEVGYRIELRPLVFESDPVNVITTALSGGANSYSFSNTEATVGVCNSFSGMQVIQPPLPLPTETITTTAVCGRQWTFGQSFAPFGVRYAFGYRHRVQPYVIGTLGYMYTSRPVPVGNAESFNFVIDSGAGVEVFRSERRSVSAEVRVHHFSNRQTAAANPGTDNVMYGVSYSFGR